MKIKGLLVSIIAITLLISAFTISSAADTSPIEIDNQITNISNEINSIDIAIRDKEENTQHAHTMAEAARQLDFEEDADIIKTAKEIYAENYSEIQELKNRKAQLLQQKEELEQSQSYIGTFRLTGYCPCSICCGKWANGITASGKKAVEGITVAADPKVLPLGTKIYIEGLGERVVQDTGGAIKNNKIDVYVSYHSKAYNSIYNQKAARVWIIK